MELKELSEATGLSEKILKMTVEELVEYNKNKGVMIMNEEELKEFAESLKNKDNGKIIIADYDIDRRNEIAVQIFLNMLHHIKVISDFLNGKKETDFAIEESFNLANKIIKRGKSDE